jgi:hypothetical protein
MPIKQGPNPLTPRTRAANAARWANHVPPTEEERKARREEYKKRAREKYSLKRSADTEPSANGQTENVCEVKTVPAGKSVVRRKPPKADRSNGALTKVLQAEESFRRRERIRELECICQITPDEATSFAGAFIPDADPDEPYDAIDEDD